MFKEIVLFVHQIAHNFCIARPAPVVYRNGCRQIVKIGFWTNVVFFIAVFTPLYVCLLRDVLSLLRDFNLKIVRDRK
ncbi:uncharacterized protein LOC115632181 [Scaptodrosophila lebanonensis]|uniref:Uncharacterized protein LOC115632181 n=1 Tax=Drosophila lebanonensis TaxID=7225 RepID=A0A6J2UAM6_DROLE|nr:uncharacterized protein LOC115632181 [Scaptodrosophila lebanonensis]